MPTEASELNQGEKLAVWIYRNLLASGVILVCAWFLFGEIRDLENQLESLEDRLSQQLTDVVIQSNKTENAFAAFLHRDVVVDYGTRLAPEPSTPDTVITGQPSDEYEQATQQIDDFLNEFDAKQSLQRQQSQYIQRPID